MKKESGNHDDNTEEIESEIEMMMRPTDDKLTHDEIQDIADAYEADFEDVLQIMQSYLNKREKDRENDFNETVKDVFLDTDKADLTMDEMWDFWVKNGYEEEMPWLSKKDFSSGIKKLMDNPNQLSLFTEDVDVALANKAKASGISKSILKAVYSKGAAAWKSGHRPRVSQQQWAMGRVNSFITGKGGSRKVDAKLWARAKKSKKRKNESINEGELRKFIRSVINEIHNEEGLASPSDLGGADVTRILPYSDLVTAIAMKFGWDHDLTQQVSYALEIKNPQEREKRIIDLLHDYDAYDDFFHYLRMNEGDGLDELYPLMVGEDSVEEGVGKYLAGAALAASLAGAPMKSSAQTPVKDFAKEKISMVKDKVGSLFNKKTTADLSQKGGGAEASIDSLNKMVGKIQKIGDNRFQTVGTATSDNLDMAMDLARSNGMNKIASEVKGKEISPGTIVTSAKLTDTRTKDQRVFQNEDGSYTVFITVASFVN